MFLMILVILVMVVFPGMKIGATLTRKTVDERDGDITGFFSDVFVILLGIYFLVQFIGVRV